MAEPEIDPVPFVNFGGNQRWYARRYQPRSEAELLDILGRHPGRTIKAIGSGHSWSGVAAGADIVLDMSAFDRVEPTTYDGHDIVRVGAGCRLQDLLDRLHAATDRTLPTLGAIKRQTISGAISTGTHGSGKQSLSHFATRVRMAVFDPQSGEPVIREFTEGPELLAARCGLGCLGIIVSVDLPTVPKYLAEETVRPCTGIDDAIRRFADHPLTNFLWSPYSWRMMAFERRVSDRTALSPGDRLKARLQRLRQLVMIDIVFHLLVLACRKLGRSGLKVLFTVTSSAMPKGRTRIDDSEHILTINHHYFRHEEMEVFVSEPRLAEAAEFLRVAVEAFADRRSPVRPEFQRYLLEAGLEDDIDAVSGSYVHHYPLFFRRVLPEDTLISMAASLEEPVYSISLFTYDAPSGRDSYYAFCSLVARVLRKRVDARLHWGKHFPLRHDDIAGLYPRFDEFRSLCRTYDRDGVLRNAYSRRVLGLPPGRPEMAMQAGGEMSA